MYDYNEGLMELVNAAQDDLWSSQPDPDRLEQMLADMEVEIKAF